MGRIRTNIEIDEWAVHRVMEMYGLRTKTEAVDLALQSLAGQPMSREEMRAMHGSDPDHPGKPPSPPRLR
jgi:Arc/MetJ family transcription regulator